MKSLYSRIRLVKQCKRFILGEVPTIEAPTIAGYHDASAQPQESPFVGSAANIGRIAWQ
jgi:hypothetical protein